MNSEFAISVENVSKTYHIYRNPQDRIKEFFFRKTLFTEFHALQHINFNIDRGEVVGIIGRNGSGKSTLLQIVAGTLQPTSGSIHTCGRIAALLELGSGFNTEFTGRENVYINGAVLGLSREEIDSSFADIEAFADIGEFIDRPVKIYSSGMYVRLAFAISVNVKADILIIDEALAVGDTAFSFKCLHRMEELLSNNTTILLVSHDIQLVKQLCQRIVYLNNGQMVYTGDCETGSELYLMDIRTEQQKAEQNWSIQLKPPLNDLNGFSFGNQLGHIIHISMGSGECEKQHFQSGERVWLKVVAHIDPSVRKPRLAMVIRDEKGYNLFGYDSEVLGEKSLHPDAEGRVNGMFLFTCRLQPGNYSVTMRLEDFQTESLNILLDKQINAICFKVLSDKKQFYGVVNLDGCFGEVDVLKLNIAVPEETN